MIIADDGLQFHIATKQIIIQWNEVANARIQMVKVVTTIRIEPKFPRKYHGRFQAWLAPEFMIGTVALRGSAEALLKAIKGHPKYIGSGPI